MARLGIATGLSMASTKSYEQAKKAGGGRAGSIVPQYSGAGPISYKFQPSGRGGYGGGYGGIDYASIVADFQKRETAAREANIAREKEIRGIYGGIIGQYEKGGAFREAGLADIERTKTRAVGAGTQQMISSGMYGTTTAAAIPAQAEAQAGQARLKLEDILQERTTQAKIGLAGFAERIEQPYPDYNMLLQSMIAQGSR